MTIWSEETWTTLQGTIPSLRDIRTMTIHGPSFCSIIIVKLVSLATLSDDSGSRKFLKPLQYTIFISWLTNLSLSFFSTDWTIQPNEFRKYLGEWRSDITGWISRRHMRCCSIGAAWQKQTKHLLYAGACVCRVCVLLHTAISLCTEWKNTKIIHVRYKNQKGLCLLGCNKL